MPRLDPWNDKEKKQFQFTKPTAGSSIRRAVGTARKNPEPKPTAGPRVVKPGPKTPRTKMPEREMPKRVKPKPSMDTDLRTMGMSPKQKETFKRDMLDDMRKRNVLRARKAKRG